MRRVTLDLPGCKSVSQRALILAALAQGESRLVGLSTGDDSVFLQQALRQLGWSLELDDCGSLLVVGRHGPQTATVDALTLGEGGSTLRFLVPLLAAVPQDLMLGLAPGLRARPQQVMVDALAQFGASLTPTASGFHLQSSGRALPQEMQIPVDLSSQFFSGFLMASGKQAQSWKLGSEPVSRGYLDMTVCMLQQFRGPDVLQIQAHGWQQQAGYGLGQDLQIPSDASAVVFFAVAAILQQREIQIRSPWDLSHPDIAVLNFLRQNGLLQVEGTTLVPMPAAAVAASSGVPIFDLQDSPDSGPALAVLASQMPNGMVFRNPERLRFKESNRLDGMQHLAAILGGTMSARAGELRVKPGALTHTQAAFDSCNDHRLAMAAGIASLRYPQLKIAGQGCVAKSFPDFWNQLARLQ
ncbi:MAG: hypothetical protein QM477_06445 [Planctomycetota bacterium]